MSGKVLTTGLTNRHRSHVRALPRVVSCVCTYFPNYVGSSLLPRLRWVVGLEAWVKHIETGVTLMRRIMYFTFFKSSFFSFFFSFLLVGSISRCLNLYSCLSSFFWYSNYFWPFNARQLQFIFHVALSLLPTPSSVRLFPITFEILVSTEPSPTCRPTLFLEKENRSLEVISYYIS